MSELAESPAVVVHQLVGFGRRLRDRGIAVNPANIVDLCQAMDHIDMRVRSDVKAAASATLLSNRDDLATFNAVFDEYWNPAEDSPVADKAVETEQLETTRPQSPPPVQGDEEE